MVGFGYDSHKFEKGLPLIIGGIKIISDFGCVAHSDGDALIHSLVDALLGASGLGDIGTLYPDNDEKYKNADSTVFLTETIIKLESLKLSIENIDITILLETPKLKDYKEPIKNKIAALCGINPSKVNIKAKTNEKMGFIGRNEGIAVYSICQLFSTEK